VGGIRVLLAGVVAAATLVGCGHSTGSQGVTDCLGCGLSAGRVTVLVRLIQIGGPSPGTQVYPEAGTIEAIAGTGTVVAAKSRTAANGYTNVALPAGTYRFQGREGQSGPFYCQGPKVTITPSNTVPQPVVQVACIVP
jgi:hypothetical protein